MCFIIDSADPLRKVYSFLDEAYADYIGVQLFRIPPPDADGKPDLAAFEAGTSYADHFLAPFLEALDMLGVRPRLVYNHQAYAEGRFVEHIRTALNQRERVREIIETISGRELARTGGPSHRWTSAVAWTALPSPASTTRTSTGGQKTAVPAPATTPLVRQVAVAAGLAGEVVLARRHLRSLWQGPRHHGWILRHRR